MKQCIIYVKRSVPLAPGRRVCCKCDLLWNHPQHCWFLCRVSIHHELRRTFAPIRGIHRLLWGSGQRRRLRFGPLRPCFRPCPMCRRTSPGIQRLLWVTGVSRLQRYLHLGTEFRPVEAFSISATGISKLQKCLRSGMRVLALSRMSHFHYPHECQFRDSVIEIDRSIGCGICCTLKSLIRYDYAPYKTAVTDQLYSKDGRQIWRCSPRGSGHEMRSINWGISGMCWRRKGISRGLKWGDLSKSPLNGPHQVRSSAYQQVHQKRQG